MNRVFAAVTGVCVVVLAVSSISAEVPWPEEYIPANADAIAYVDVKGILESKLWAEISDEGKAHWFAEFRKKMKEELGIDLDNIRDCTAVFTLKDIVHIGPENFAVIVRFKKAPNQEVILQNTPMRGSEPIETIGTTALYAGRSQGLAFPGARTVVFGNTDVVRAVLKQKASREVARLDEGLQAALDNADMSAAVIAAGVWPEEVRKEIREELQRLCKQAFRGGFSRFEGVMEFAAISIPIRWGLNAQSASITLHPDGEKGLQITARFSDSESASQVAALAQAFSRPLALGLKHLGTGEEQGKLVAEKIEQELDNIKPLYAAAAKGKTVIVRLDPKAIVEPLKKLVNKAQGLAGQVQSANNLRQIGMGCIVYANNHDGKMPPDIETLFREGYIRDRKILHSPRLAKHDPVSDYEYLGAGALINEMENRGRTVIAFEKLERVDAANLPNAVFADGHVELLTLAKYKKLLKMVAALKR